MLYLISIGLHDELDMSLRALDAAKSCDAVYLELFTTKLSTTPQKLSTLIGKQVTAIKRSDLEEHSAKILKQAKTSNVAVLVGGDALAATTHSTLLLDAKKLKIPYKVIHSSSIFTAIGECGLSLYRFGRIVTVPFKRKNYEPTEFYLQIEQNHIANLHTLILLDIDSENDRYMTIPQAVQRLLELEAIHKKGLFSKETKIIAACALGSKQQKILYADMQALEKSGPALTPAVLILPAKLSFFESEFLTSL